MVDRYVCSKMPEALSKIFATTGEAPSFEPAWNLSRDRETPIVGFNKEHQTRSLKLYTWGLVLQQTRRQTENAMPPLAIKVEDIFREDSRWEKLLQYKRCLIPADAFYLNALLPSRTQPFAFRRADGHALALAGLYTGSSRSSGEILKTFALITVPTDDLPSEFGQQARMPVAVDIADWPAWLGEVDSDPRTILSPCETASFHAWPVSRRSNWSAKDGSDLLEPVIETFPGDPLPSFKLRCRELRLLKSKLDIIVTRYHLDDDQSPDDRIADATILQHRNALRKITTSFADQLAVGESLFDTLGRARISTNTYRDDHAKDGYGRKVELAAFCNAVRENFEILCAWKVTPDTSEWIVSTDQIWSTNERQISGEVFQQTRRAQDLWLREAYNWLDIANAAATIGYGPEGMHLGKAIEGAMRLSPSILKGLDAAASKICSQISSSGSEPDTFQELS
ncbi:SOS response-associated peptidase [Roseomonas haemaphysalidis]|uniref:Abasic site processing protein n=1 Tax=Roseomonas haemaphysalidis TaxID=2768162 RepID=A0ABS3KW08_9PROT|nr:SOS response-associated peptidase family protein [Roseomonas haemaphysalidis]MBO1081672.1 SOS response-associated peptidase family protein [Roseomonas haemaphysalidis]